MTEALTPHDLLFKAILKDKKNLQAFLLKFLPKPLLNFLDLSHLSLLPEEKISLPKDKRLIPDLVAEVPFLNKTLHIYLFIEHKSYLDPKVYLQVLNYIVSLYEEALREGKPLIPVLPIIYYHGKKAWVFPKNFIELFSIPLELKDYFLDFALEVIDVARLDDEFILKGIELYDFISCLLWLQKYAGEKPLEEVLYVLERLVGAGSLLSEREKVFFGFVIKYVARIWRVDGRELLIKLIERGGEKVERELKTIWDDIYEEALQLGMEKGLQQGLQQGLQRGLILDAQEMVLEALVEKFGKITPELMERIKKIEDRQLLKKLLKLTFRVSSIEEIQKEILL